MMPHHVLAQALVVLVAAALILPSASQSAAPTSCVSYVSNDTPETLAAGTPGPLFSTIIVPDAFQVSDVSIANLTVDHAKIGALKLTLNAGTVTVLLKDVMAGGTGANLTDTGFDDAASTAFPSADSAPFTGMYVPAQSLDSAFAAPAGSSGMLVGGGGGSQGNWTLRIVDLGEDHATRSITLDQWTLVLCPNTTSPDAAMATPPAPPPADNSTTAAAAPLMPATTDGATNMTASPPDASATPDVITISNATVTANTTDGTVNVTASSGPDDDSTSGDALSTDTRSATGTTTVVNATQALQDLLGNLNTLGSSVGNGTLLDTAAARAGSTASGTANTTTGLFDRLIAGLNPLTLAAVANTTSTGLLRQGLLGGLTTPASTTTTSTTTDALPVVRSFLSLLQQGVSNLTGIATGTANAAANGAAATTGTALGSLLGTGALATALAAPSLSSPAVAASSGAADRSTPVLDTVQSAVDSVTPAGLQTYVDKAQSYTDQYLEQAQALAKSLGITLPTGALLASQATKAAAAAPATGTSALRSALTTTAAAPATATAPATTTTTTTTATVPAMSSLVRAALQQQSADLAQTGSVYSAAVSAAVANYKSAIDSASTLVSKYLDDYATGVKSNVANIQAAIKALEAQLGGTASAATSSTLKDMLTGTSALGQSASSLGSNLSNALQTLFGAYKSQIQAAEGLTTTATDSNGVIQSAAEQSLTSLNTAIGKINTALEQYTTNSGPLAGASLSAYSNGLTFLQKAVTDLETQVSAMPSSALSSSAQSALSNLTSTGNRFTTLYQQALAKSAGN